MGGAKAVELALRGGAAPRRVTPRANEWTAAMAGQFVEALAETCNVTLAAKAIKRSVSSVYRRRTKDASFRLAWQQALGIAYSQLEMVLLERALHGVEKVVLAKDGTATTMREYSDRTALALLRMHREQVTETEQGVEAQLSDEARERVVARIERLRIRIGGNRLARRTEAARGRKA